MEAEAEQKFRRSRLNMTSLEIQTAKWSITEHNRDTMKPTHVKNPGMKKPATRSTESHFDDYWNRFFRGETGSEYLRSKWLTGPPEPSSETRHSDTHGRTDSSFREFTAYMHCPYNRGRGCHVGAGTRFGTYQRCLRYTLRPLGQARPRLGRTGTSFAVAYYADDRNY